MKISSTAPRKSGVHCQLLAARVRSLADQNLANPHRLSLTQAPHSSVGDTVTLLCPNKHWSVGYSGRGNLFDAPISTAVCLFSDSQDRSHIPVPHTWQPQWTYVKLSSSAVKDLSCLGFPQKQALGQVSRASGVFRRLSQKTLARNGKPRSTQQWCATQIPSCRQVGCVPAILSSGPSLEIFGDLWRGWRQLPLSRSGLLLGTAHTH